jgi:hypothetical protein
LNQVEDWAIATQAHFKALENEYMSINVPRPKQVLKSFEYQIGGITRTRRTFVSDFSEMTEEQVQLWNRKQDLNQILYKCSFPFGMSTDKLVETQRIAASKWFDASVAKLAAKIQDKGINADTMTISNSYVDRNLNTLITDGEKKVKAQTIFANGAIKRPHFRYLIK